MHSCRSRQSGRSDRSYYPSIDSATERALREELAAAARRSAELHRASRKLLVDAVRRGAAAGLSQRQIAACVGRSQPEIARLLRFIPTSKRGQRLASQRAPVIATATAAGFANVRVFGSVARGEDGPESDIDLLVTPPEAVTLFDLARLERDLSELLGRTSGGRSRHHAASASARSRTRGRGPLVSRTDMQRLREAVVRRSPCARGQRRP